MKAFAAGVLATLMLATPALAQRGGGGSGWDLLGEGRVGIGSDRDVIRLAHNEEFYRNKAFRKLRFVVEGGEVRMKAVRLVYINGHAEDIAVDRNMQSGENFDLDLQGERSYLQQIEMLYRGKFGFSFGGGGIRLDQASVKVYGELLREAPPADRGPPPPPPRGRDAAPGWETIASERFDRRDSQIEFRAGRREGRIGQIRFQHRGDSVSVREVRIRFGNGETQVVRLDQRLAEGDQTRPIDLEGDRRFIERATVILDPRRRPGSAEMVMLGTTRPGRDDRDGDRGRGRDRDRESTGPAFRPDPGWIPLGRQEVGFGVDRDVVRVGQSEDWFRNRGFNRVHFAAEGNDVHMSQVTLVYINGHREEVRFDRLIPRGTAAVVDLPGRRSYLREIEMVYRARPGFGGRATVSVYGEPPPRRR